MKSVENIILYFRLHHSNMTVYMTDKWAAKEAEQDSTAWEIWQWSAYLCLRGKH